MQRSELVARLRAAAHLDAWRYIPHAPTPRQLAFLDVVEDEALFGGAAGGGKSDALLMCALRHVHVPGYSAIVFRRTYTDLALPGAIMDRSHHWLGGTDASWNSVDKRWTFPSGATIQFGYLDTDRDKYRYQSAEFTGVFFDELTQFPESSYLYMQSRLRRPKGFVVQPHARSASNPGGIGHDWVHRRFVAPAATYPFVPSTLADNPHIDADDYRTRLRKLDSNTRAQLLDGKWIRDGQGLMYRFTPERNLVAAPPAERLEYVLAVDLGSSEKQPTTAFCVCAFSPHIPDVVWVLQSFKFAGATPRTIAAEIQRLERDHDFTEIVVDQGGLGGAYIKEFNEHYGIAARDVKKANKLGFRKLLNGALEGGELRIVEGSNDDLVEELGLLQWNDRGTDADPSQPDHLTDALLYAWRHCKAHFSEVPAVPRDMTTDEGKNAYAEELLRREREQGQERQAQAWWQQ